MSVSGFCFRKAIALSAMREWFEEEEDEGKAIVLCPMPLV